MLALDRWAGALVAEGALESQTGSALFNVLRRPDDPQAWSAFVDRYAPKIYAWCRQRKLQEADARDVTQSALTRLVQNMRACTYDPRKGRFRAWLRRVTVNACKDVQHDWGRPGYRGSGDSGVHELLHNQEAREELALAVEQQWQAELLAQAKARVQLLVSARDWQIFRSLADEERPGKEVAAEHQLKVATVFAIRCRVQRKLREEARRLEGAPAEQEEQP